jgi:LPS-assembly protein
LAVPDPSGYLAAPMTNLRATLICFFFLIGFAGSAAANGPEEVSERDLDIISGEGSYSFQTGIATFTNNVVIKYRGAVLTADKITVHPDSGEALAQGRVRIQQEDQVWTGEHIRYNFKTREMVIEEEFRTGRAPIFAQGSGLYGDITNGFYSATNALITADDISRPAVKIRAKHIRIIPGEKIEATHATLYLGEVPVFYFPYYVRRLTDQANSISVTPGYRSRYGPFLLGTYNWYLNEYLDGELHLDYRLKRGVAGGPDVNYHLGRWGEGSLSYYFAHDEDPTIHRALNAPVREDRYRIHFEHLATPFTNLTVRSLARYQNDIGVVRDFFPGEYRRDPQPSTFVEVNKFWQNFSLDILAQPRLNDFYETVERLPDVRLTGFRQQVLDLPIYYESESTLGYYRRLFAETNMAPPGMNFEAARADTYHQLVLPHTFFGWLNVTPRAGARYTYYSEADGPAGVTEEAHRTVFNTGAEVSFKASRIWAGVDNPLLEMDGLRHIVEPSANYVYVPRPNYRPQELPQFDYEFPSLRLLPLEFPDYNAIDSIDTQNAVRFGLRNKLQTKRNERIEDFLRWEVFTDWRLRPRSDQETFSDAYSDLAIRPRSWLTLQSQTRFDIEDGSWRMSLHSLTFQPNNIWHWTIGHFYLEDDFGPSPTALGQGNNLITSGMFYKLNEDWAFRMTHHVDLRRGRLQEQYYTVFRDLRSWTAALTAGLRQDETGSEDFTIAFTFSLKAIPRYGLRQDSLRPYSLLGR